jgi:hypothetical protein
MILQAAGIEDVVSILQAEKVQRSLHVQGKRFVGIR